MPPGLSEARDALNVMLGGVNITEETAGRSDHGIDYYEYKHSLHLYATGPEHNARGFDPHTDPYDIFVAQLIGRKLWTYCVPRPENIHAVFGGGGNRNDGGGKVNTLMHGVHATAATKVTQATSAERSELHLQNLHSSESCSFYTADDLTELDWYVPRFSFPNSYTSMRCMHTKQSGCLCCYVHAHV